MVINPGHPLPGAVCGTRQTYANKKAADGYKAGNRFADGALISFDLFEASDKDNAVSEGARKAAFVMPRDSQKFAATDGWDYQAFDPKTRTGWPDAKAAAECHGCHLSVNNQGYVFSTLRNQVQRSTGGPLVRPSRLSSPTAFRIVPVARAPMRQRCVASRQPVCHLPGRSCCRAASSPRPFCESLNHSSRVPSAASR